MEFYGIKTIRRTDYTFENSCFLVPVLVLKIIQITLLVLLNVLSTKPLLCTAFTVGSNRSPDAHLLVGVFILKTFESSYVEFSRH